MGKSRSDSKKIPWEMVILSLLSKKDMYGSQIAKEIKSRSGGKVAPLMGSIYPVLYKLTDNGYVKSYEKSVGRRLSVVYYRITKKGRTEADVLINRFHEEISLVENFMNM
ncbi:MAG: PadR family transcriptional regulator [Butyrivibrio sp.]|nr:PadR family transcriptional regulator [Butyrivibrio sp.]